MLLSNINIENIWKRGFEDEDMLRVEEMCRKETSEKTDELLEKYIQLEQSMNGNYISSDLMKMVYPFYAENIENRRKYNLAVSNSAACLANEMYRKSVCKPGIERCIFIAGAYGAGKSFFVQSIYDNDNSKFNNCIVYEGSITTKTIDNKIDYALEHNIKVDIIILNPTFELSLNNIKERAGRIGRDVKKEDAVYVYANIYDALKRLTEKYPNINYAIYNKNDNIPQDMLVSSRIEDLNHGTNEDISNEYDRIMKGKA